ncbi:DMT family transporter [Castellaniella sp. S9]|uniref:DMT family transporter n=1 Tax=Castellaniella sp. S9 TaxID=2993652 RepID=UPI0022B47971|nr:DMT family transporter [Castellaniella sp. S9]
MTAAMVISGTIGWLVMVSGQPVLEVVFWRCVFGALALWLIGWRMGLLRLRGAGLPALSLAAAFLYALAALWVKQLTLTPHLIALIQVCVGIAMLAPFAHPAALAVQPLSAWASLLVLGVVNTGVMYVLLYGGIQKLPTALTGALSFIYPVVAILVDWAAFGHRLQWPQWIGVAAILAAAAGMRLGWSWPARGRGRPPRL